MTSKLKAALTAVLLLSLVAGGMGTAVAETTDIDSGETTIVNDDDAVDADELLDDVNLNVLGGLTDGDSAVLLPALA
ncbi:hypothetical protein [Halocatena pleomorpha]|uniref:Uncharacterized protein n=1 Tax=Halocatena pleomorpha TaxID=1785090 RepID=A0A3P3R4K6_9EURY|nr:hypothetical protein [Halocatena pleomorpha]RRJ28427.1 hypothetical protein EIK79_15750 [Halocatena pleomorpha]